MLKVARLFPPEAALIYTNHEVLRGYCPSTVSDAISVAGLVDCNRKFPVWLLQ